MSTTEEATAQSGAPKASEDFDGWLMYKDKEIREAAALQEESSPETTAEVSAEAQPTPDPAPQPEVPKKGTWREQVLDDVDDAFLQNKPAGQLYDSYKASVAAMQKAQREANESRSEAERLRRQVAEVQSPSPAPAQPPLPNPTNDPEIAELNRLLFEDTPTAIAKLEERFERKAKETAQQVWQQETYRHTSEQAWQNLQRDSALATMSAAQKVAELYGVDEATAQQRVISTFSHIKPYEQNPEYGPAVWANEENYLIVVRQLFGDPPPPATEEQPSTPAPTPKPDLPNPPGSGRPAPVTATPSRSNSPLTREQIEMRKAIADIGRQQGIPMDSNRMIARGQQQTKRR